MRRGGNLGAPLDERDDNRLAPRINLRGYWLQRPGFEAKDRTRTRVRQGRLAIRRSEGRGRLRVGLRRLCDVGDKAVAG